MDTPDPQCRNVTATTLAARFAINLERLLPPQQEHAHLLLALSGGIDSTVLLHLLRFRYPPNIRISAAHFDHRMRGDSGRDAAWVRGLCVAWGIPLRIGVAETPIHSENDARERRYAFLRTARREVDADWILTAHHADDQAETVLFRVLRGSGLAGLRGIPEKSDSLLRPLLPFWREELRTYAVGCGLEWREDSTNAGDGAARNRLRNHIIPQLEREVAPGARQSLVRLAELARESEAAWDRRVAEVRPQAILEAAGCYLVARRELARYDPELGARLIRDVLRRLRSVPDRTGTRAILQFITDAPSGRETTLSGGVRIRLEHDWARFSAPSEAPEADQQWVLEGVPNGRFTGSRLLLGGRGYRVDAGVEEAGFPGQASDEWSFAAPIDELRFPLRLRSRLIGDRIHLPGGSRSVKKLLIDRKVPVSRRATVPLLIDAGSRVLWVAGVSPAVIRPASPGEPVLKLVLKND